jgi:hypothetical protein
MSKNAPKKTLRKHRAMYETAGQTIRAGLWTQEYAAFHFSAVTASLRGFGDTPRRRLNLHPRPRRGVSRNRARHKHRRPLLFLSAGWAPAQTQQGAGHSELLE